MLYIVTYIFYIYIYIYLIYIIIPMIPLLDCWLSIVRPHTKQTHTPTHPVLMSIRLRLDYNT